MSGPEGIPDRGSRRSQVIRLAGPIVLGQISHILVGFADTFMVARIAEKPLTALAALGASYPVYLVVFLFFSSTFLGTQTLCARRLGEERLAQTGTILTSALALALLMGVPATLLGVFVPELVMGAFTDDPETAAIAADYLQYRWGGGAWLVALAFVFKGFYWGVGSTRTDLVVSVLFNLMNIVLNWVFIYGNLGAPSMGAAGAGLASALANGFSVVVFIALTLRPKTRAVYATFRRGSLDPAVVRKVLRLSLPRSMQALAFSHVALFFMIIGAYAGDDGLAASAVVWRFTGFTVLISIGIGTATATLVGRELGAGRPDSAEAFAWSAVRLGVGSVAFLAVLLTVLARPALRAFLDSPSAAEGGDIPSHAEGIVSLAVAPFILMLVFQVVDSVGIILARALNGAGAVMFVMFAEFGVAWLICIPAALIGGALLTDAPLLGVWLGWAAYCSAWALTMALRWRTGSWKTIEL